MTAQIGLPRDRVDGPDKVKGSARYAAEFARARLAHAVLVQSTRPSGTCRIDARAAEASPGVVRVLTPANAPRLAEANKADPSKVRILSLLQDDQVHYNGQPIAVVVAETLEQARGAARRIDVQYSDSAAVLDFDRAKAKAYPPKKANMAETDVRWGDPSAGFARASVTVDAIYTTPDEHHNPLEPHATMAYWEGDQLTVHDATQGVFACRNTLAQDLGIPAQNIRVISPFVGGGFGCKGSAWSHVVLAAMAARVTGRPVKLVLDRPQMFAPVGHRPRTEQHVVLGATRDGALTAIRHEVTSATSVLEDWTESSAVVTRMLYACPNGDTSHRLVKLNIGTPTFQRAPGEATGTFALESAIDELAYKLGLDPIALRLVNHADADAVEHKPFSSKSLRTCYERGAGRFGWTRRTASPGSMRDGRWLVGWGMATATYPAHRSKAAATARILADGTAVVQAGTQDLGTGTYTIMSQVAADALGLTLDRLRFELGDTLLAETPVSGGSQTAASVAPAVQAACAAALDQLIALALADQHSPVHGAQRADVKAQGGWLIAGDGQKRDAFAAVIARNGGRAVEARAQAEESETKDRFAFHSFGAVFAEVRVDAELGVLRLARLHGTYDVGRILNAKTARSQLIGGLVWGAGLALFEQTLTDTRDGRVVNANLSEYHVPVNADIEEIDVAFVDGSDTAFNPLGARGIGEIGITGAGAAIANAVYHATGKRIRDLPITLDRLI